MDATDLLADAFGRLPDLYDSVASGLDEPRLTERPGGTGNSIGWLLWHLARVEDDHVADLAGSEQVWDAGWRERFDLPLSPHDTGFGHTDEQVGAVRIADPSLLVGYYREVHARTTDHLAGLSADDLDRVVDAGWDPPVTAGVRLVSVQGDALQHLGQAAYLKGLQDRSR